MPGWQSIMFLENLIMQVLFISFLKNGVLFYFNMFLTIFNTFIMI